jgi:hypothetical protein
MLEHRNNDCKSTHQNSASKLDLLSDTQHQAAAHGAETAAHCKVRIPCECLDRPGEVEHTQTRSASVLGHTWSKMPGSIAHRIDDPC